MTKAGAGHRSGSRTRTRGRPGRPKRPGLRARKQLLIDIELLRRAMVVSGRNQSDTVNDALMRMTENAAIVEGFERLRGAFPEHPDANGNR